MPGRVFITGASGFVGSAVLEELLSRGYSANALVHRGELQVTGDRVRTVKGDLFDRKALDEGVRGCDAVIHVVGIIMEKPARGVTFERIHFQGTKNVVDATVRNGVRRYVHMSALGSRADAASRYHRTKFQAEQYVRGSGLAWTIFRPSLIHGPRGEFMRMEADWARHKKLPFLFMPYFGAGLTGRGGAGKLQPVYVKDVARAFVDALENPKTVGEVYPLGGSEELTWPELHRASGEAVVGKRPRVVAVPAWYAKVVAKVMPGFMLPFNHDQVVMSQEDNTCDITKFRDDFGWEPQSFRETLGTYAKEM
jgi:NADH dehydrogenase